MRSTFDFAEILEGVQKWQKNQGQLIFISDCREKKRGLKKELVKIAANNDINLNRLMIAIVEWFLEERKDREFTIKLR